ncbi:conserved hypothetical protein [Ricinus communis]|uniref:Uncharacterized protein n=1 Tax=Ricinus communis TaxID=3988 RepID=B9RI67_RICCO|nr:conserved hypothetical protein [Ricinus communis]
MPIGVIDSIAGAFFNWCMIHGKRDLADMMVDDIMRWDLRKHGGFAKLSSVYAAGGK